MFEAEIDAYLHLVYNILNKEGIPMSKNQIISKLKSDLPLIIARKEVYRLTGGLISPRHLANLDSAGLGPSGRVRIGRLIGYERESFISWLSDRMRDEEIAKMNERAKDS